MEDRNKSYILKLEEELADIKLRLEEERAVKKSEVLMNYDLKCYNKKLEVQINELVRINENFLDKLVKLRLLVESLLEK
jgi:phosphotransferase system IIA component